MEKLKNKIKKKDYKGKEKKKRINKFNDMLFNPKKNQKIKYHFKVIPNYSLNKDKHKKAYTYDEIKSSKDKVKNIQFDYTATYEKLY